jgi:transcriptional regulator with XRE-family HTH domain
MGIRLKELRQARNLTQEKLARMVDVGLDAIRKWERGDRTPRLDMAERLADALELATIDELIGRRPPTGQHKKKKDD